MIRALAPAACTLAVLAGRAGAETCPPAVALDGDAALIGVVGDVLAARGIAIEPAGCPAVAARIERRGDALVVDVAGPGGAAVQRVVGNTATAATVIESFSRSDVGTPLLAARAVRRDEPAVAAELDAAPASASSARGIHVFGAFETSFASDGTAWLGAHVGACVMIGRICAAARLRGAGVVGGPGAWEDVYERRGTELLFGVDIPFAIGGWTFSPGFAAGLGQMHTRGGDRDMRAETGGPRADVHATLSIPVGGMAIDLFGAADLTQETRVEWGPTMAPLPDEPRLLVRFGAGLRYGGL